jgi:hypothetical protein
MPMAGFLNSALLRPSQNNENEPIFGRHTAKKITSGAEAVPA